MLSRACVGIEVSVQLTLLVLHSTSLLCLLHDRPAARFRPLRSHPAALHYAARISIGIAKISATTARISVPLPRFGPISCWNSESPKQTVQNVCRPAARISAPLPGFHYANSSWNSEGPRSGWNSESPNSSWNSVRPNSSWNWDFSEGGAECMHSEYVR